MQRVASLPRVKLAPMVALGPMGEKLEHLDAVVAFAFAGKRIQMFRVLGVLTVKCATGDLPEECRFLLHTQPTFLKEEESETKMFDGDEWR